MGKVMGKVKKDVNNAFKAVFGTITPTNTNKERKKIQDMPLVEALDYLSEQWRLTVSVVSNWKYEGDGPESSIKYYYVIKDTMSNGEIKKGRWSTPYKSYSEALKEGIKNAAGYIPRM